ncbi:KAP family NTPase [Empedobacter falsenii]
MNDTITNNDSTLIINLNEEYKIKIEEGKDFYTSIFKEVYEAALKNVEEIITQSSSDNKYDDFNNIIAFTGERGKGKSSSMISFRDALVGHNDDKHKEFFNGKTNINTKKFATIDIVDPSLFRGGESLFEIILAQMFQYFQEEIKRSNSSLSDDDRRIIIKQFQEVFENLQIIKNRNDLYKKDSIEALSRLATSSNLRYCFKKLVDVYLKKFENNFDFLVIAIDDFDLNISGTYDMLEDIRQFLIQSNIIVLIACKTEQLKEAIYIHFKNQKLEIDLDNKALKYLEKFIPLHRRISLPDLLVNNTLTTIKYDLDVIEGSSTLEAIFKTIYERTNLFICIPKNRNNTFLPDNFRGIINILGIIKKSNAIQELLNYVVEQANIELNSEFSEVFNSLEKQKNETLNISLANSISEIEHLKKNLNSNNILFATNPLNVNIGDVYSILDGINKQITYTNNNQTKFLDLLDIYYSLRILSVPSKDESFFSFYNSLNIKIFRKSLNGKFRDCIMFNKLIIKDLLDEIRSDEDKIWFMHFFIMLGKYNAKFRFEDESPYFKSINGVNQGLFSPLGIFSNILFTNKIASQINLRSFENSNIIEDINIWNNDKRNLNNLFKNSMFYKELMQYFEEETNKAHKTDGFDKNNDGEEIYFNTLYVYFTESLEKALNRISIKYPYLNIDINYWINNHPIIKRWIEIEKDKDLKEIFVSLFQKIFNSQGDRLYKMEDIEKAKNYLEDYDHYFTTDQSDNPLGVKKVMTTLVNNFENSKEIHSKLSQFRKEMNQDLNVGLKNIEKYLIEISNG